MYNVVLVKYSELALKGQNRGYFEKKLAENIKRTLKRDRIKFKTVRRFRSCIEIDTKEKEEKIRAALKKVFGIANFSFACTCSKDIEKIKKLAEKEARYHIKGKKSFKVEASRHDKSFKYNSMEIGRIVGEKIYYK